MIHTWGKRLDCRFDIIFDDNPSMQGEKKLIEKMSNPDDPTISAGYGERTVEYPLKVNLLTFASSVSTPEIQVADLIAGISRENTRSLVAMHAGKNADAKIIAAAARSHEEDLFQKKVVWADAPGTEPGGKPRGLRFLECSERLTKILSACFFHNGTAR